MIMTHTHTQIIEINKFHIKIKNMKYIKNNLICPDINQLKFMLHF